jgi:tetratricopeptide (TPR) repeat protein
MRFLLYFTSFGLAISLFTCCTPAYYKLHQSGYKKIEEKNYDGAMKDFDSSLVLNNEYWLAYLNRGTTFAVTGNCQRALVDLNKSIELHRKNPIAFNNRAMCKSEWNENEGAIADYKEAIRLDSKFYLAYTRLGLLYAKLDSCEQAVHYLKIAVDKKAYNECMEEQQVNEALRKCTLKSGTK